MERFTEGFNFRTIYMMGDGKEWVYKDLGRTVATALEGKESSSELIEVVRSFPLMRRHTEKFIDWINEHNLVYGHLLEAELERRRVMRERGVRGDLRQYPQRY